MSIQLDCFADGSSRSFPPHLDPAAVVGCRVRHDVDRDHVGASDVGKYGNNARVFVFEVLGAREVILYAQQCITIEAAKELQAHHEALLEAHRQAELF